MSAHSLTREPVLLAAAQPPKPSFVKDIVPIFTKSGCANSNCHGSIRGQNGFKLSLFGYEPAMDFAGLTRDNLGRRVNTQKPDESLVLLKGSGQTYHDGGMRFVLACLEEVRRTKPVRCAKGLEQIPEEALR